MKRFLIPFILAFAALSLFAQDAVWINEVWYDTPLSGDSLAFVELKGTPGLALDTFLVYGINGNGGTTYQTISLVACTIPADSYFVIGADNAVPNVDLAVSAADYQNGSDNIMLGNLSMIPFDAIGYGSFLGNDSFFTGLVFPTYDIYNAYSLSRLYSTGVNYYDYIPTVIQTPGAANVSFKMSTINAVQLDSWSGSALADSTVHLVGMVTAVFMDDSSYYIQSGTGAWNGVEVWKDMMADSYAVGDTVIVVGAIYEYNGQTVVEYGMSAKGHTGNTPVPTIISAGSAGEEYEGQFIELNDVTVLTAPDGFGEWLIEDSNGDTLKVGDRSGNYTAPSVGVRLYSITGILDYSFSEFKLEPRSDADLVPGYDLTGVIGLADNPADSSGTIVECVEMSMTDTTDATGAYLFELIPAGTYTLIVSHSGYVTDTINAVFSGTETFDLTLFIPANPLTGIIGLSDNPADSSGTVVYLEELTQTDTTDAAGYYEFLNIPDGSYTLIVSHDGYVTDTINAVFTGSETFDLTLAVATYTMSGIIGLSDNPADSSGTAVYCVEIPDTDSTDASGYYEFPGLPAGSYTLIVTHDGYFPDTINAVFTGSETFDVTLVFDASGITDEAFLKLPTITEFTNNNSRISFIYNKKSDDYAGIGIYDLTGRTLYSTGISSSAGSYNINVNTKLPKGVYFINILEGKDNFVKKFVIIQ